MRVRGALERKDAEAICGWLSVASGDGAPQCLEIVIDGQPIAKVAANAHRADVEKAGFGSGLCGFVYRFPPTVDPEKAARARIRLLGTELYLADPAVSDRPTLSTPPPAGAGSVFVLGPARSGTSITFLALHTVLKMPGLGESHVLPIFQRMLFCFYEYARQFVGQSGVLASRLDVVGLEAHMIGHLREFYFKQFGGAPFVDKTPGLEALVGAPFIRKVFPGAKLIVMTRNGVEIVESYRRKFKTPFEESCGVWAKCEREIRRLRRSPSGALFVDQVEMRVAPAEAARRIANYVGQPESASELADFLAGNRPDVLSDMSVWDRPQTLESVNWSNDEKAIFRRSLELLEREAEPEPSPHLQDYAA